MQHQDPDFGVISAVRYDPSLLFSSSSAIDAEKFAACKAALDPRLFFLFPRHIARLNSSYAFFWPEQATAAVTAGKKAAITEETLLTALYSAVHDPTKCYRLRPFVYRDGRIRVESNEVVARSDLFSGLKDDTTPENSWVIYIDTEATPQSSITMFKTSNRDPYTAARERVLPAGFPISSLVEVLVYNKKNQVTEGSLTNVAFWRGGVWVTPSSNEIGGLRGAVKAELLDRGLVRELKGDEAVDVDSIKEGEKVLLMNGIQGCTCGYVRLGPYRE
ncbi:aminotransferase class IV-domain-containing protein [Kockiozyma suomiensis]|uniref:aminotransferase class IV-domain-containing protein n=1 Tax=Kockiozyma suomiensis TaxID=1337062 RepID=UPI00334402A1